MGNLLSDVYTAATTVPWAEVLIYFAIVVLPSTALMCAALWVSSDPQMKRYAGSKGFEL